MDEYTKYHCKDPRLGQITVSVEKELHQSVHSVYDASSLTHSNASFKYFAYHTALDISSTHYLTAFTVHNLDLLFFPSQFFVVTTFNCSFMQ